MSKTFHRKEKPLQKRIAARMSSVAPTSQSPIQWGHFWPVVRQRVYGQGFLNEAMLFKLHA